MTEPTESKESGRTPVDDGSQALVAAFGGKAGVLDAGLPGVIFVLVYTVGGRDLRLALIVAVSSAALLSVVRLVLRQSLQHALGGFLGVGIAAFVASRTGKAEDFYLPGLLSNIGYGAVFLVSILIRWPAVGVLLGLIGQAGTSWRREPVRMRAYQLATGVLALMFALRLAVQVPLYFAGESALTALGAARVAMGLPLYLLTLWITYRVLRGAIPEGLSLMPQPVAQADAEKPRET